MIQKSLITFLEGGKGFYDDKLQSMNTQTTSHRAGCFFAKMKNEDNETIALKVWKVIIFLGLTHNKICTLVQ